MATSDDPCRSDGGFSLVELLMTTSIMGVLASVSMSAFTSQLRFQKRLELRETTSEQLQLLKHVMANEEPIDMAHIIDGCDYEELSFDPSGSWIEVEVTCSSGALRSSRRGFAFAPTH